MGVSHTAGLGAVRGLGRAFHKAWPADMGLQIQTPPQDTALFLSPPQPLTCRVLLNNSASPGGRADLTPPPPKVIGQIFLRVFSQSKIFSGAFGASQFRPKKFFGASNNSGSPAGGGSPHSPWTPPL